jgi:hypothetical protein
MQITFSELNTSRSRLRPTPHAEEGMIWRALQPGKEIPENQASRLAQQIEEGRQCCQSREEYRMVQEMSSQRTQYAK